MAKKPEKLPKGFFRTPAMSLRVQVRCKGHKTAVRTFPLLANTPYERQRQRDEAEAWATVTRRSMHAGVLVTTHGAGAVTLGDALRRYEADKLDPDDSNQRKDINRIRQILSDPIANRTVATLRSTDIASYRDDLIERGWKGSIAAARGRAIAEGADKHRLRDIDRLAEIRAVRSDAEGDDAKRRRTLKELEAIAQREKVKQPARTTISNKIQLITRTLKHLGQTVANVPNVSGSTMPRATPGRDRRLKVGEYDTLLAGCLAAGAVLQLGYRLAIETALRRERLLEVAPHHLVDIGGGRLVIMFPKEKRARKRTGIVPVTPAIARILEEAAALQGRQVRDAAEAGRPYLAINGNTFDHQWRSVVLGCGIEDLHFHDLRHEATSRLFERGLTTAEVMSITGHSTSEMVDRYAHYSSAIVFDKLVRGPDPDRIRREIELLIEQYEAAGGDHSKLRQIVERLGSKAAL